MIKVKEFIMAKQVIWFMEKNIHGAWVVYGVAGIKQYYYYTKKEARQKYIDDCNVFFEDRR